VVVQASDARRPGQPHRNRWQVDVHSSFCAAAINALHVSLRPA
jgi:hypothetical protein